MKNKIRVRLAELEINQNDLAKAIEKDKTYISRVVNNSFDVKLSTAFKIAKALDCKIEDIFIYE